jgi:phosphatidylinositol alpha-1,6-mannosyltransferase
MSENRNLQRVLIMAPSVTGADGISAVSRHVVKSLSLEQDHCTGKVEVWSLSNGPTKALEEMAPGVRIRMAGGRKFEFASWGLKHAVKSAQATLVIVLHMGLAPVGLPLVARGARLVLFLHGIEVWRPLGTLRHVAFRKASLVMANSNYTIARFRAANPACAGRAIHVCHLGIPAQSRGAINDSACKRATIAPLRSTSGLFALIVGRMAAEERYKGHDLLLEIWPTVVATVPDATLLVAGDGDDRARLEAKAGELGLSERVRFLGRVSDEALTALYRDCAFFVMPSRHEGFGLVFLEAMQARKACIGALGAAAELIQDGLTGFLVDPDNPQQVLDAIVRLFREERLREEMGVAGAERVAREFSERQFQIRFRSLLGMEAGLTAS